MLLLVLLEADGDEEIDGSEVLEIEDETVGDGGVARGGVTLAFRETRMITTTRTMTTTTAMTARMGPLEFLSDCGALLETDIHHLPLEN